MVPRMFDKVALTSEVVKAETARRDLNIMMDCYY